MQCFLILGNLFFLYVFGKLVEEEEGAFGVVASYLICGIGANIASMLLLHGPGLVRTNSDASADCYCLHVGVQLCR